jgi:hypothetical protein
VAVWPSCGDGLLSICLVAGAATIALLASEMTLAWDHSVERIRWEEDWRARPAGLELLEARVRGSGAGMDPPPEAQFRDGWWRWRPALSSLREVTLRRSGATADWRICRAGQCEPIGRFVPLDADPVILKPCDPGR